MGGQNLDMIHAEFHRNHVLIRVAHLPAGVEPILDDDRGSLFHLIDDLCDCRLKMGQPLILIATVHTDYPFFVSRDSLPRIIV